MDSTRDKQSRIEIYQWGHLHTWNRLNRRLSLLEHGHLICTSNKTKIAWPKLYCFIRGTQNIFLTLLAVGFAWRVWSDAYNSIGYFPHTRSFRIFDPIDLAKGTKIYLLYETVRISPLCNGAKVLANDWNLLEEKYDIWAVLRVRTRPIILLKCYLVSLGVCYG